MNNENKTQIFYSNDNMNKKSTLEGLELTKYHAHRRVQINSEIIKCNNYSYKNYSRIEKFNQNSNEIINDILESGLIESSKSQQGKAIKKKSNDGVKDFEIKDVCDEFDEIDFQKICQELEYEEELEIRKNNKNETNNPIQVYKINIINNNNISNNINKIETSIKQNHSNQISVHPKHQPQNHIRNNMLINISRSNFNNFSINLKNAGDFIDDKTKNSNTFDLRDINRNFLNANNFSSSNKNSLKIIRNHSRINQNYEKNNSFFSNHNYIHANKNNLINNKNLHNTCKYHYDDSENLFNLNGKSNLNNQDFTNYPITSEKNSKKPEIIKNENEGLNSNFTKNTKLINDSEVLIESNFFLKPYLFIIKENHGKFENNEKLWTIPLEKYNKVVEETERTVERIKDDVTLSLLDNLPLDFLSKNLNKIFKFRPQGIKKYFELNYEKEKTKLVSDIPVALREKLYDFQLKGIEFGIQKNCRFLLADEMGVGKTIQTIALMSIYTDDWPVLIICPSSLKCNWKAEILNWLEDIVKEDNIQIIQNSNDNLELNKSFYIISYDMSLKMEQKLKQQHFNFIVADEAHYIKSRAARRTKILTPLMQKSKRLILLSGTPIVSKPSECFTLLKVLRPDIFNNFNQFASRYCNPRIGRFGMDYSGSSNIRELKFLLKFLMIRRLKIDVLEQLPPKKRQKIILNVEQSKVHRIKALLDKGFRPPSTHTQEHDPTNTMLMKAYSLTGEAKIKGIYEYINYLIDNECKFLIFAHHINVLDKIECRVKNKKINYMRIDGNVSIEQRDKCVSKFQNDESCRIAILAITACATGITLTKASTVVFAEMYFTPATMIQAEDRAHRIGQDHTCVNIHYLFGKDTVDEIIFPRLEQKFSLVSNALDIEKRNLEVYSLQDGEKGDVKSQISATKTTKIFHENLRTKNNSDLKNLCSRNNFNINTKNDIFINNNSNSIQNNPQQPYSNENTDKCSFLRNKSAEQGKITFFFEKKNGSLASTEKKSLNKNIAPENSMAVNEKIVLQQIKNIGELNNTKDNNSSNKCNMADILNDESYGNSLPNKFGDSKHSESSASIQNENINEIINYETNNFCSPEDSIDAVIEGILLSTEKDEFLKQIFTEKETEEKVKPLSPKKFLEKNITSLNFQNVNTKKRTYEQANSFPINFNKKFSPVMKSVALNLNNNIKTQICNKNLINDFQESNNRQQSIDKEILKQAKKF